MIKKGLLSLGFLAAGLAAQAQIPVFHQEFEAAQAADADKTALGWYEFINLQSSYDEDLNEESADVWSVTGGVLSISNNAAAECENQSWQRAIKFRNLNLEEGKSYRLSFKLKGDNVYAGTKKCKATACLMQGVENADVTIGDAINIENITAEGTTYTKMFYFASKEEQDAKYDAACAGKAEYDEANKSKYFLTINVYNPGNFEIDDVKIEETTVQSIELGEYVIKVNFGYQTNIASIVATEGTAGIAHLDNNCVTVTANGEPVEIECVELKSNGLMYIYATEPIDSEAEVKVSFKNPGNITYNGGLAAVGAVLDFEDYVANYNEDLAADEDENISHYYAEAVAVSANPAAGSFFMDPSTSEFTVKFSLPINTKVLKYEMSNGDAVALKDGTPDYAEEVTFIRTGADLTKGAYALIINNIETDKGTPCKPYTLDFEVGKIQLSETVYEQHSATWFEGEYNTAQPTNGWISYFNGAENSSNANRVGNMVTRDKGVGFYFCQRDASVPAKLTLGEKEDAPFTIPGGDNVIVSLYLTKWQNAGGGLSYSIAKKNDPSVIIASGSANAETNTGNFGETVTDMTEWQIKLTGVEEGEYILTLEQNLGWSGTIVYGAEVKTYTETEGDKDTSETLLAPGFGSTANNAAPVYGSGWRIYAGGTAKTPGQDYNYNGARIFDLGYKNLTKAFYNGMGGNAETDYIIYGEGETYETAEGATLQEPVLNLKSGKIQVTYYCTNWKTDSQTQSFQIINRATGDVVYERTDEIKPNPGGDRNASIEAQKVQFEATISAAGEYLLKFFTDGEGFVGNIKVESVGSKAVQYTKLLNEALEPAIAEAELANEKDEYRGTTRDALNSAITEYSDPKMHTGEEYTAAIKNLENLVASMSARRANIEKYPSSFEGVNNGLTAAEGTKYEALDEFPVVKECYEKYNGIDPVSMTDADLAEAVAKMGDLGTLLKNMVEVCIPEFLTKQIAQLSAAIVALDSESEAHEYVIAADNAISDDQELVANLKKLYVGKMYSKIASGDITFSVLDPDLAEEVPEEIDMTMFIQNAGFYTNAQKQKDGAKADANSFPGWNIEIVQNSILADWGWGGPYNCSPTRPYSDAAVCTAWGTSEVNVKQVIDLLPVGIYNTSIKVGDGTSTSEESLSFGFYQVSDDAEPVQTIRENDGGARNAQPIEFTDVKPAIDGNFASFTLGAGLRSRGDFSKCDDAALVMTGKDPNFDYAAAAAEILGEVTAIQSAQLPAGEPVNVKYYDLNGVQTNAPKGVCIKIETYKNGTTVVKKAIK